MKTIPLKIREIGMKSIQSLSISGVLDGVTIFVAARIFT